MKFTGATDIPGKEVALGLNGCGGPKNQPNWFIDYLPNTRHFRITFNAPQKDPRVVFVHETRVSVWERAE